MLSELVRLRDGVGRGGAAKAKELSKGRLLLRLEDTRSVAGWLGGQELLLGGVHTVDEVVALLEAVTVDDLRRVAPTCWSTTSSTWPSSAPSAATTASPPSSSCSEGP